MTPLITAVITTFQRPKLLQRAIESVQKQTLSNLAILVSDSASQDETQDLVARMALADPRIIYHRHPQIITPIENYQFGMEQVKTPFFSFLSDDDYLLPPFYQTALTLLNKYPAAQFFLGSTIDASLDSTPISAEAQNWPKQELFHPPHGLLHVLHSYFNWTGALYRTRSAFPLNPHVVTGDYDFILRFAAQHPFTFSPIPCAVFTHHPGSFSSQCGLKLLYPNLFQIADAIYSLRPPHEHPLLSRAFTRCFLRKSLRIALQSLIQKNTPELRALAQAIRLKTHSPLALLFPLLIPLRLPLLLAYTLYRKIKSRKVRRYLNKSITPP